MRIKSLGLRLGRYWWTQTDWTLGQSVVRLLDRVVAVDAVGSSVRKYGWICLDADRLGGEIFAGSRPKKLTRWSGANAVMRCSSQSRRRGKAACVAPRAELTVGLVCR